MIIEASAPNVLPENKPNCDDEVKCTTNIDDFSLETTSCNVHSLIQESLKNAEKEPAIAKNVSELKRDTQEINTKNIFERFFDSMRFWNTFPTQLVINAKTRTEIDDVFSFQISVSVATGIESLYSKWRTEQINSSIEPVSIPTPLKELCRVSFKQAFESVFSGSTYSTSPDTAVTLSITITHPVNDSKNSEKHSHSYRGKRKTKRFKTESNDAITQVIEEEDLNKNSNSIDTPFNEIVQLTITRRPIMLEGRYIKSKRHISQTNWILPEDSHPMPSVEQFICGPIAPLWKADKFNFHAAGREDSDVRMLGAGRPFVLMLTHPRLEHPRQAPDNENIMNINEITDLVNQRGPDTGVFVRDLKLLSAQDGLVAYKKIQVMAEEKQKLYGCVCYSKDKELSEIDIVKVMNKLKQPCVISQKTPVRVSHRRSMLIRTRTIECEDAIFLTPQIFVLKLRTDAGTYVKEFIHGDFGRTTPSISSMLSTPIQLVQLDVLGLRLHDMSSSPIINRVETNDLL